MTFIAWIVEKIWDIGEWFWDAYKAIEDEWWCPGILADAFYAIQRCFGRLSYDIDNFGEWLDDALSQVGETLSWSNIRSLIRSWLPDIEDLVDWFQYWWYWVEDAIDDWWNSTKSTVRGWIYDLETWTISELNSIQAFWVSWFFDMTAWTTTQINNAVEGISQFITNVNNYYQTTINNITEEISQFITNVQNYYQTTINNITEEISQFITNVNNYTTNIVNNITETITELIDWDRVTKFINDWWSDRLLDLQGLIDSNLRTWFPFYDDLVSLWNDIVDFFTNPWEWLLGKLADWVTGPEE
ncbi:hypothetical protein ES708_27313 [subsurface metagenome]